MKLRILGNKLRFRLTKEEVKLLSEGTQISESVQFSIGNQLRYQIKPSKNKILQTSFKDQVILIEVPSIHFENWYEDERIGIYDTDGRIEISLEKDFQCLHKRPGEDESDNFPNPAKN